MFLHEGPLSLKNRAEAVSSALEKTIQSHRQPRTNHFVNEAERVTGQSPGMLIRPQRAAALPTIKPGLCYAIPRTSCPHTGEELRREQALPASSQRDISPYIGGSS